MAKRQKIKVNKIKKSSFPSIESLYGDLSVYEKRDLIKKYPSNFAVKDETTLSSFLKKTSVTKP